MNDTLSRALLFHQNGVCVVPLPPSAKTAHASWWQWQDMPQTQREVEILFRRANGDNVCGVFGRSSDGLFGLDLDSGCEYSATLARLAGLGIVTWIVRSNTVKGTHAGGGTPLLRGPCAVQTSGAVRGQGAYSILHGHHPADGTAYTIENIDKPIFRLNSLREIRWLDLKPAPPPTPQRPLTRHAWALLTGDEDALGQFYEPERGKIDRSDAECSLMCALVRAGRRYDEIERLFLLHPGPGKFREKLAQNPRTARAYLETTFRAAIEFINANPGEIEERARRLREWALAQPWPGRTGSSDRAIFLAHCQIAQNCGVQPHGASARQLAELAGVDKETASKATRRLIKDQLLELEIESVATLSNRYRLIDQSLHLNPYTTSHGVLTYCTETCAIDHDAFRWGALNKSGAEVYTFLLQTGDDGARVSDIKEATGRHPNTISGKLRRMLGVGLVEPLGDGYWRAVPDANLDEAAEMLGTAGKGKAQRRQHFRERRTHKRLLQADRWRGRR